jgi:hypothetical protein
MYALIVSRKIFTILKTLLKSSLEFPSVLCLFSLDSAVVKMCNKSYS